MTAWLALLIGLVVGACLGVLMAALCVAAKDHP